MKDTPCHGQRGWILTAFDWQGDKAKFTYRREGEAGVVEVSRARPGGPDLSKDELDE